MMTFRIVFLCVLTMLGYMACGYGLTKTGAAVSSHAKSLSGLLLYICCPCLIFSSFQSLEYSKENALAFGSFFVAGTLLQLLIFGLLYLCFRKKLRDARYRILTAGTLLGNVGFFGQPLLVALFPDQPIVACYSMLLTTSMNILVFTIGVFMITGDRKYMSLKSAFLNPSVLTSAVAIVCFLLRVRIPAPFSDMITALGKMCTPLCMVILGMRLASMRFRDIFARPFAYAVSGMKLIVMPLIVLGITALFPAADPIARQSLCVLCACPSAAVVLSMAELHECEQELSANVVLMTTLLSLVTIPCMVLLILR